MIVIFKTLFMNRRFTFFILISLAITALLPSCKKFEGSQTVPAYIRIDTMQVQCEYWVYGANTHKIIDAWVYIDDNIVGCYELPATFPVLKEGEHKVAVYPGIARDGIRDLRAQYPFMAPYERSSVNLVKDSMVTLRPVFHYYPVGNDENMHIWQEDFDRGTIKIQAVSPSDVEINLDNSPLAWHDPEGIYSTYSAKLVLTSDTMEFRIATEEFHTTGADEFKLPTTGAPCMLEMDYKCSDTCYVGLRYRMDYVVYNEPLVRLKPTGASGQEPEKWNKIYINIGPYLVDYEDSDYFQIYFSSWDPRNEGTQYFYFDNFKLIYRDR